MKKYIFYLMLGSWWLAGNAYAEGPCPPGFFPAVQPPAGPLSCGPTPGYNQQLEAAPQPYWANRYGAVAWDVDAPGENGIGVSANQSNFNRSKKKAPKECVKSGGSKNSCKVVHTFANGFVAMAVGATGVRSPHVADKAQDALDKALLACRKDTTDSKIWYGGCSPPVLVH